MPPLGSIGRALRASVYALLGPRRLHRLTHRSPPTRRGAEPATVADTVERFHVLAYESGALNDTYWLGVPILKSPQDCWMYQEIIHDLRPDLIVETGTYLGGSARFFASILDLVGHGEILTVDDKRRSGISHPRITAIVGGSTSPQVLSQVRERARVKERVLVTLDSDHRAEHVLREMRAYAPFVTLGSYLVVEDTNINGHPVLSDHGPGPMEAVRAFLSETDEFVPDPTREKFLLTYFPSGWLKRRRPAR